MEEGKREWIGRVEEWKDGRMEEGVDWKNGGLEEGKGGRLPPSNLPPLYI